MNNVRITLPTIFKSRTFWTAVFELLFVFLVHYVPGIQPYLDQIIDVSLVVTLPVIARFAGEDIALALKTGVRNAKYDQ